MFALITFMFLICAVYRETLLSLVFAYKKISEVYINKGNENVSEKTYMVHVSSEKQKFCFEEKSCRIMNKTFFYLKIEILLFRVRFLIWLHTKTKHIFFNSFSSRITHIPYYTSFVLGTGNVLTSYFQSPYFVLRNHLKCILK